MAIKMKCAETAQLVFLDNSDEPESRLYKLGAQALSNSELLALLLVEKCGADRMVLAQGLLQRYGGLHGLQKTALVDIDGFSSDLKTGLAIKAAIELGRRLSLETQVERTAINSPSDAAALVQYELSGLDHEQLWVISTNQRNQVVSIDHLYKGSVNSSQVRVGELFKVALSYRASAIIVAHNHPSGDPTPSPDDVAVTRAIVQAGKLLDIDVLDHIVIGMGRWVSLKERGLGFS
ncbi:MAG: DNA repair protein RadC [Chloroflexi bacterium]|nr:DNA repair protein RadC [Chloroflexota bacterium]